MRHKRNNVKFGRSKSHREALVSMLVVGLIKAKSIRTSARKGDINARRRASAVLGDEAAVKELFSAIVPMQEGRNGGYTRIVKLGQRAHDGTEMAVLSWVNEPVAKKEAEAPASAEPAEAK